MSDERILLVLRALAESDREKEASPELEARLMRAFHSQKRQRAWRIAGIWASAGAAAAAAIVMGIAITSNRPPLTMQPGVPQPAPVIKQVAHAPAVQKPRRGVAHVRQAPPREIVTQFFPLMEAPPPFEGGELVRVSLPADAMRSVGLPVDEDHLSDRVEADVLVGEEGLARAIRFVKILNR